MKYFKYFPKIQYDLDASGETKEIVDSFRFAKIVNGIKDDITFYRFYEIADGERPDHTSYSLYKTADYYWTFFVANPSLKSLEDWPLAQADLSKKLSHDYTGNVINISTFDFFNKFQNGETVNGLVSGATAIVDGKNTSLGWISVGAITGTFQNGEIIQGQTSGDTTTIAGAATKLNAAHHYEKDNLVVKRGTAGAAKVTNLEYEQRVNETRKRIKVIRPELIEDVARQFRRVVDAK
jgi:hypothetical protein